MGRPSKDKKSTKDGIDKPSDVDPQIHADVLTVHNTGINEANNNTENDPEKDTTEAPEDLHDLTQFKVAQGYDVAFFQAPCDILCARQMVNETDRSNESDSNSEDDVKVPANGVLWGFLISLDAPSLDKKKNYSIPKISKQRSLKLCLRGTKER